MKARQKHVKCCKLSENQGKAWAARIAVAVQIYLPLFTVSVFIDPHKREEMEIQE